MEEQSLHAIFYIYKDHKQSLGKTGNQYLCKFPFCNKSYEHLNRLFIHLRTHIGQKPYTCKICGKCFNENGNLKTHERVHTGERPYKCPFEGCNSQFKAYGHLRDHKNSHMKIKKFQCDCCKKSFSRPGVLKIHQARHKGISQTYAVEKEITDQSPMIEDVNESHQEEHPLIVTSEPLIIINATEKESCRGITKNLIHDTTNNLGKISFSNSEQLYPIIIKQLEQEKNLELEKMSNNNNNIQTYMKTPRPLDHYRQNHLTPRNNNNRIHNYPNFFYGNSPTERSPFSYFLQNIDDCPNIPTYNTPGSMRYFYRDPTNSAPNSFSEYAKSFETYFGNRQIY